GKGWDYEFEIVDADGHEWEVNIDAKTGAVRGTSREWF
ncbi:MAG TPA: PepSY domain-containing protein, partial [Methylotenera sp.]|nr:PepSY domain-containing protein [Methylotenera sp.]